MLKSFPIIKVIKKNWKVIALLVLLLIVALLILAIYPKVHEGISGVFVQEGETTDTTATIKLPSVPASIKDKQLTGVTINLGLQANASNINALNAVSIENGKTNDTFLVKNLLPNLKYNATLTWPEIDPSTNKVKETHTWNGKIVTLPDPKNVPAPTFKISDLANVHTQLGDDKKTIECYLKFDTGIDLPYDKDAGADKSGGQFPITSFKITDPNDKNKVFENQLTNNPETGEAGWCKVTGFTTAGKKYELAVVSTCNISGAIPTKVGIKATGNVGVIESKLSDKITVYTAPVAVTDLSCVITPDPKSNQVGPYTANITFNSVNSEETSYATSLNCKGFVEKKAVKQENGRYLIKIENIPPAAKYPDVYVNAIVNCPTNADNNGVNKCPAPDCKFSIPSTRIYKKSKTDTKSTELPGCKITIDTTAPVAAPMTASAKK